MQAAQAAHGLSCCLPISLLHPRHSAGAGGGWDRGAAGGAQRSTTPGTTSTASLCLTPSVSRGGITPAERPQGKSNKNTASPSPACLPASRAGAPLPPRHGQADAAHGCGLGTGCPSQSWFHQTPSAEAVGLSLPAMRRGGCQHGAAPWDTQNPPVITARVLGQPSTSHPLPRPLWPLPPSPLRERPKRGSTAALCSGLPLMAINGHKYCLASERLSNCLESKLLLNYMKL